MTLTIDEAIARSGGMPNGFDNARLAELDDATRTMIERRNRLLGPSYKLFYDDPLHFVRAEGVYMYAEDGTRYLDVYNNVPSIGHCHPRVVEAVQRQMSVLNTHTRYLHGAIIDYSERLLATVPGGDRQVMYTCTGSEASDLALRMARHFTGAEGFVVTANAYHGHSTAVAAVSPSLGRGVPLGAATRTVPAPDAYRADGDVAARFASDVADAIDDLRRHGLTFAGLIADSIFSSDGIFSEPAGFMKDAIDIVRKAGGLYIADEVQPGFGRTGDHMWGFQRHGLDPDLVVLGKPMGNGMPIGGVIVRSEIGDRFGRTARYFNTFGGNPVSIAAAGAVLDVIRDEGLLENARTVGAALQDGLRPLAERFACIGDVRGAGLFVGVDMVSDRDAKTPDGALAHRLVNALRRRRVLISASGSKGNVLKVRPPLPFSTTHCAEFLEAFEASLAEVA